MISQKLHIAIKAVHGLPSNYLRPEIGTRWHSTRCISRYADPRGRTQFHQAHVLRHAQARFNVRFQGHSCSNYRHRGCSNCKSQTNISNSQVHFGLSKFKILVLDVGSNDLDISRHPKLNLHSLTRELVTQAKGIGSKFHVEIIICLPIPGGSKNSRALLTPQRCSMSLVKDLKHIHAWAHRGLFKRDVCYLNKHRVHLNLMGTLKYFHSVQAFLKFHAAKICCQS